MVATNIIFINSKYLHSSKVFYSEFNAGALERSSVPNKTRCNFLRARLGKFHRRGTDVRKWQKGLIRASMGPRLVARRRTLASPVLCRINTVYNNVYRLPNYSALLQKWFFLKRVKKGCTKGIFYKKTRRRLQRHLPAIRPTRLSKTLQFSPLSAIQKKGIRGGRKYKRRLYRGRVRRRVFRRRRRRLLRRRAAPLRRRRLLGKKGKVYNRRRKVVNKNKFFRSGKYYYCPGKRTSRQFFLWTYKNQHHYFWLYTWRYKKITKHCCIKNSHGRFAVKLRQFSWRKRRNSVRPRLQRGLRVAQYSTTTGLRCRLAAPPGVTAVAFRSRRTQLAIVPYSGARSLHPVVRMARSWKSFKQNSIVDVCAMMQQALEQRVVSCCEVVGWYKKRMRRHVQNYIGLTGLRYLRAWVSGRFRRMFKRNHVRLYRRSRARFVTRHQRRRRIVGHSLLAVRLSFSVQLMLKLNKFKTSLATSQRLYRQSRALRIPNIWLRKSGQEHFWRSRARARARHVRHRVIQSRLYNQIRRRTGGFIFRHEYPAGTGAYAVYSPRARKNLQLLWQQQRHASARQHLHHRYPPYLRRTFIFPAPALNKDATSIIPLIRIQQNTVSATPRRRLLTTIFACASEVAGQAERGKGWYQRFKNNWYNSSRITARRWRYQQYSRRNFILRVQRKRRRSFFVIITRRSKTARMLGHRRLRVNRFCRVARGTSKKKQFRATRRCCYSRKVRFQLRMFWRNTRFNRIVDVYGAQFTANKRRIARKQYLRSGMKKKINSPVHRPRHAVSLFLQKTVRNKKLNYDRQRNVKKRHWSTFNKKSTPRGACNKAYWKQRACWRNILQAQRRHCLRFFKKEKLTKWSLKLNITSKKFSAQRGLLFCKQANIKQAPVARWRGQIGNPARHVYQFIGVYWQDLLAGFQKNCMTMQDAEILYKKLQTWLLKRRRFRALVRAVNVRYTKKDIDSLYGACATTHNVYQKMANLASPGRGSQVWQREVEPRSHDLYLENQRRFFKLRTSRTSIYNLARQLRALGQQPGRLFAAARVGLADKKRRRLWHAGFFNFFNVDQTLLKKQYISYKKKSTFASPLIAGAVTDCGIRRSGLLRISTNFWPRHGLIAANCDALATPAPYFLRTLSTASIGTEAFNSVQLINLISSTKCSKTSDSIKLFNAPTRSSASGMFFTRVAGNNLCHNNYLQLVKKLFAQRPLRPFKMHWSSYAYGTKRRVIDCLPTGAIYRRVLKYKRNKWISFHKLSAICGIAGKRSLFTHWRLRNLRKKRRRPNVRASNSKQHRFWYGLRLAIRVMAAPRLLFRQSRVCGGRGSLRSLRLSSIAFRYQRRPRKNFILRVRRRRSFRIIRALQRWLRFRSGVASRQKYRKSGYATRRKPWGRAPSRYKTIRSTRLHARLLRSVRRRTELKKWCKRVATAKNSKPRLTRRCKSKSSVMERGRVQLIVHVTQRIPDYRTSSHVKLSFHKLFKNLYVRRNRRILSSLIANCKNKHCWQRVVKQRTYKRWRILVLPYLKWKRMARHAVAHGDMGTRRARRLYRQLAQRLVFTRASKTKVFGIGTHPLTLQNYPDLRRYRKHVTQSVNNMARRLAARAPRATPCARRMRTLYNSASQQKKIALRYAASLASLRRLLGKMQIDGECAPQFVKSRKRRRAWVRNGYVGACQSVHHFIFSRKTLLSRASPLKRAGKYKKILTNSDWIVSKYYNRAMRSNFYKNFKTPAIAHGRLRKKLRLPRAHDRFQRVQYHRRYFFALAGIPQTFIFKLRGEAEATRLRLEYFKVRRHWRRLIWQPSRKPLHQRPGTYSFSRAERRRAPWLIATLAKRAAYRTESLFQVFRHIWYGRRKRMRRRHLFRLTTATPRRHRWRRAGRRRRGLRYFKQQIARIIHDVINIKNARRRLRKYYGRRTQTVEKQYSKFGGISLRTLILALQLCSSSFWARAMLRQHIFKIVASERRRSRRLAKHNDFAIHSKRLIAAMQHFGFIRRGRQQRNARRALLLRVRNTFCVVYKLKLKRGTYTPALRPSLVSNFTPLRGFNSVVV